MGRCVRSLLVTAVLAASFVSGTATPGASENDPTANAVLARAGANAIVLWDVTDLLPSLLAGPASDDAIVRELESDAARAAGAHSHDVPSAQTIAVRIVYARIGKVSPVYRSATYAGFERLMTVVFPAPLSTKRAAEFALKLKRGDRLPEVTIDRSGSLPPR